MSIPVLVFTCTGIRVVLTPHRQSHDLPVPKGKASVLRRMKHIEGRESPEEDCFISRGLCFAVSRQMIQLSYSALGLPLPCSNAHVLQGIPGKTAL